MIQAFADTYYFIAVINRKDAGHAEALRAGRRPGLRLVTTAWILTELADALSAPPERRFVAAFIRDIQSRSRVTTIPATQEWFDRGLEFYEQRPDKSWTLTDCISFEVMRRFGMTEALTGDRHFAQAGFVPVLARP